MRKEETIPVDDRTEEMKQKEKEKEPFFVTRKGREISALLMIIVVALIASASLNRNSGTITVGLDDKAIGITCKGEEPIFLAFDRIREAYLTDTLDMGEPVHQSDWDSGWCGVWRNDEYGEYTLYAYSTVTEYLVIKYDEGVIVLNQKTKKITEELLTELQKKLS